MTPTQPTMATAYLEGRIPVQVLSVPDAGGLVLIEDGAERVRLPAVLLEAAARIARTAAALVAGDGEA